MRKKLLRGFTPCSNRIRFSWGKLMRNKESIAVTKMTFANCSGQKYY